MKNDLQRILEEGLQAIEAASSQKELDEVRSRYTGRSGALAAAMKRLRELPPEERPEVGRLANEVKGRLEAAEAARREALARAREVAAAVDVTLPGRAPRRGAYHPLAETTRRVAEIFRGMGFDVFDAPELDTERYNFEALAIPATHPARDEQDSFYIEPGVLLRTHTSNAQIHAMEALEPPLRIISFGRCFRRDASDPRHSPVFHQIEGLLVDERVSLAQLRGVLTAFAREIAGEGAQVRFRPDFFPFTEPSADFSVTCFVCRGKGCRVCGAGWLELGGAGMVDPEVFANVGYDPERWTGFAFGMGLDRIAMLAWGIPDIRMLLENDMRMFGLG